MSSQPRPEACGPAVIASALACTREEASAMVGLVRRRETRRKRTTWIDEISKVVGAPYRVVYSDDVSGEAGARYRRYGTSPHPTLAQWLRSNRTCNVILRVSSHFIHVCDGVIIEANGVVRPRARVTHAIFLP